MAIDPKVARTDPETNPASVIENEIPAYRAISPLAIFSLMLGALSILSFAHPFFLASAVAAVVLGVLANRKIRSYSDVLTGGGFAQAGIALGLIFGLATVTTTTVQSYLRTRAATQFAESYAKVLQEKTLEDALWYQASPEQRKDKTGDQVAKEMKEGSREPMAFEMQTSSLRGLKTKLANDKDLKLQFSKIESHGVDGMTIYAAAVLKLTEPDAKHEHGEDEYAMIVMKSDTTGGRYEWKVDEIKYPYKPDTFAPAVKPVDDGHGHAH